ncbi:MAG: hypothetical protein APF80_01070 [Alphaproteobacteria bacterium BRH_c36]|nr:MAG: hypothetical protein APF80_01070 [Alphaproteobacteria bacterium BRH_c36]
MLRAAIVQIDFQPAFATRGIDYLSEPGVDFRELRAPQALFELEQSLSKTENRVSGLVSDNVSAWRSKIKSTYERWYLSKIKSILEFAVKKDANIIIFPEYSIPCNSIGELQNRRGNCVVIAGTHTVTANSKLAYQNTGLAFDEADIGRSICPILGPGQKIDAVHKLNLSQWELGVHEGHRWSAIGLEREHHNFNLCIQICIDFLSGDRRIREGIETSANLSATTIHIVPALTPKIGDFYSRATDIAHRKDEIVLFSNIASVGGSKAFFRSAETGAVHGAEFGEELISFIDVFPENRASAGKATLIPSLKPIAREFARVPILYWGVNDSISQLEIFQSKDSASIRDYLRGNGRQLLESISNKTLRHNFGDAFQQIETIPAIELLQLCETLTLPATVPTLDEWRCIAMYASARFLEKQAEEPGLASEPRTLCASFAAKYRDAAADLVAGSKVKFNPEQAVDSLPPDDILDHRSMLAARLSSTASSGQVDFAFVRWLQDEQIRPSENKEDLAVIAGLVDAYRPLSSRGILAIVDQVASDKDNSGLDEIYRTLLAEEQDYHVQLAASVGQAGIVVERPRLLIFGYSSSIVGVLKNLSTTIKPHESVITVVECKNRHGIDSAPRQIDALARLGFQCRFLAIESIARFLATEPPQPILLGANAITPEGVINTMGSLAVTTLASANDWPCYVISSSRKILRNTEWQEITNRMLEMRRPSNLIFRDGHSRPSNVDLVSYAYDIVPFSQLKAIVTERGGFDNVNQADPRLFEGG